MSLIDFFSGFEMWYLSIYKSLIPESKPLPSSMFNNDLFFPAVVSQQNLARVSFYYWTDQKLFYL